MDGNKLEIFILVMFRILKLKPTISKLPTADILLIATSLNILDNKLAPKVIIPWYIKTLIEDKITPIPKLDENIIELIPSKIDFAKECCDYCLNHFLKNQQ